MDLEASTSLVLKSAATTEMAKVLSPPASLCLFTYYVPLATYDPEFGI